MLRRFANALAEVLRTFRRAREIAKRTPRALPPAPRVFNWEASPSWMWSRGGDA